MVDVLAKVRPLADPKQSRYDGDYRALCDLKCLVDERGLAAIVLREHWEDPPPLPRPRRRWEWL